MYVFRIFHETLLTISTVAFDDHSIIDKKMSACLLVPGIEIPVLHGGPGSAVLHAEGTVVRRAVAFAGFLHRSRLSLKWTSVGVRYNAVRGFRRMRQPPKSLS